MPNAPASVSDRLEELEKRLENLEKRLLPSSNAIVGRFMLACLDRADGAETSAVDIFDRYVRWSREHYPLNEPLDIEGFSEQLAHHCKKAGLKMRRIKTLYCIGVAFSE